MLKPIVTSLFLFSFSSILAGTSPHTMSSIEKRELKNKSIVFTENKGQIVDQSGKARPDVLFTGEYKGLVYQLRNNGISYQLYQHTKEKQTQNPFTKLTQTRKDSNTIYRVDVNWQNCNTNLQVIKNQALPGFENFYRASPEKPLSGIRSFKEVMYKNLYQGIDLRWFECDGNLKYDYLCAAGADFKEIQLTIDGASHIALTVSGCLEITTPFGVLIENAPFVTQAGKILKSKWVLQGNHLNFEIKNLDHTQPYVIDPIVRNWSSYYGGSQVDMISSVTCDDAGNIYFCGSTNSGDPLSIATSGAHQTLLNGSMKDGFVAKFTPKGERIWATYFGGSGDDSFVECALDAQANIYLTGSSSSTAGIASANAHQSLLGGSYDAIVVKLDSTGALKWSTYYGGSSADAGFSTSVDASGNVYVAGSTNDQNTAIASPGAYQTAIGGITDGFLVKFTSTGTRLWGTYYGGSDEDYITKCIADSEGNIYVGGNTTSPSGTAIASVGAFQNTLNGGTDMFLAKFKGDGSREWGTYNGGAGSDNLSAIALDADKNVFVVGSIDSLSSSSMVTSQAHQTSAGGSSDGYIAKHNPNGVRIWGTLYGGKSNDWITGCSISRSGSIYFIGKTIGPTLKDGVFETADAFQTQGSSGWNVFFGKLKPDGGREYGTYYNSAWNDYPGGIYISPQGYLYVVGNTNTETNESFGTKNAHQPKKAGDYDGFISSFFYCEAMSPQISAKSSVCRGGVITFTGAYSGPYTPTLTWGGPDNFQSNILTPSVQALGYSKIGIYSLSVNNGTCAETATVLVKKLLELPLVGAGTNTVLYQHSNNYTLLGNPTGGVFSGPGLSGNLFTPSIGVGTYMPVYSYTDSLGCSNTATVTIVVKEDDVLVYPMPAKDQLSILTAAGNKHIFLYNLEGKKILEAETELEYFLLDITKCIDGLYLLKVETKNGSFQRKILID